MQHDQVDQVSKLVKEAMQLRYSRRQIFRRAAVLGLSAAALNTVLAACGGTQGATNGGNGGGGSSIEGSKLNILAASYFIVPAQELYTQQAQEWGSQNGVEVTVDYVNWPDLQPKIGAAIQSGAGPDIIEMWDIWPFLYYENLVDVHDIAMEIGEAQGGYYDWVTKTASVDGHWYSIPHGTSGSAFAYRLSYFEQAGVSDPLNNFPKTWEELFEVGKELKAMGKPLGQALGHSLGDPPAFAYPFMWSYGAMEVEEDGETVAFNKPQFIEGMQIFLQGWKDAFEETGLSWDDSTNNRAFLSDQLSATLNGNSIYVTALESNPEIAEDMSHGGYPEGPAGRFNILGSRSYGIMKYSKNQEAAKEFLKWWFSEEPYGAWLREQQAYMLPPTPKWADDPVFTEDPKNAPYGELVKYGRPKGYAGPSNEKAAEASSKYIVVDTFARAVQSGNPEEAIQWGAEQLEAIYSR